MRTRTIFIIGFSALFFLLVLSSVLNWNYSQELREVSEYHNLMSVPDMIFLGNVNLNYNQMHSEAKQILLGKQGLKEFENAQTELLNSIQNYDDLTYVKNSNNEFLASQMMIDEMQFYVGKFHESTDSYNLIFLEFQNGKISESETSSLLDLTKSEFDLLLQKNMIMESEGMIDNQNLINLIEGKQTFSFIILNIVAVFIGIILIVYVSRFVSTPISSLLKMTKSISAGNFKVEKITTNNSDVNDLINATNDMAIKLEDYKLALIKQEKLSSIGTLSSRLAHDIRNPLTVIKARFDLMKIQKKDQLTQKDLEDFEDISKAIERISHQVKNVLDFVGGKQLVTSRYSLHEILNSTMKDVLKSEKIKISTIGPDVDIECDFEGLKIILINLITNAIQAIGKEGTIKINICEQTDHVLIEVEDSGPGVPDDQLQSIFEPLFTTKQEGTGLGLASCKSIAEQHGGTISVQNNPTRFTISLPKSLNQKETILKFKK
jgi:signal transduction histidine kinase